MTETGLSIARSAQVVRNLIADYTRQHDLREGEVGLIFYGYLAAKLGLLRLSREWPLKTGDAGRPPQIDFAIGRRRHYDGRWTPDTVIELAVRRQGDVSGLAPSRNKTEIQKLAAIDSTHQVLLLIDLLDDDKGAEILTAYQQHPRTSGRPRRGRIQLIYVGPNGVQRSTIPRQRLA